MPPTKAGGFCQKNIQLSQFLFLGVQLLDGLPVFPEILLLHLMLCKAVEGIDEECAVGDGFGGGVRILIDTASALCYTTNEPELGSP